jgi:hypothetical protein
MPDYPSLSTLGGALRDRWNRAGSFPMTTSTGVTITPEDIQRGMDLGMSFSGGGLGIKAYHSSPHDFNTFDMSKIGTGEGSQSFGHGVYVAENPAVSGQGGRYWNQFLDRFSGPEKAAAETLAINDFDRGAAVAAIERANKRFPDDLPELVKERQQAKAMLESGQPVGPRTYEVNINADPEHMLDWDKKWSEQPESVQKLLRASGINPESRGPMGTKILSDSTLGELAGQRLKDPNSLINRKAREAGIPGIKYLDQGSRATGEGSRNYVVFNNKLIDIVKKYGLAGLLGSGILATDRNQQ